MPKILSDADIASFRQTLCNIALKQFAEKGIENTSMRSIAKEAGCSSMTPYRYFTDKAELLAAVRARGFEQFIDMLDAVIATDDSALEKMQSLAKVYFEFAIEKNDLYRLMFEAKQTDENQYPELKAALARLNDSWSKAAEVGEAAGLLDIDPAMAAQLFWVGMHGLVSLHLSGSLRPDWSFEELSDELIQTLFRGFVLRS